MYKRQVDYGFVGDVKEVNADLLASLIHQGIVPVLAPLTHDKQGHMLNTNADTIAGEAAKALAKHFEVTLMFCFEKKGVLKDENDDESVIPEIDRTAFEQYVDCLLYTSFFYGDLWVKFYKSIGEIWICCINQLM